MDCTRAHLRSVLTKNQGQIFTSVRDQGNTVGDISERVLLWILVKTAFAQVQISEGSTLKIVEQLRIVDDIPCANKSEQ